MPLRTTATLVSARLGTRCRSEPRRHATGVDWDMCPVRGEEVIARQHPLLLPGRRWLVLAALLLMAACGQSGDPAPQTPLVNGTRSRARGLRRHAPDVAPGSGAPRGHLRTDRVGAAHRGAAAGGRVQGAGDRLLRQPRRQGRCVWTDERGDMVYSELKGEAVGSGNLSSGTFRWRDRPLCRRDRRLHVPVAVRGRCRRRRGERAGRRPQGPGAVGPGRDRAGRRPGR